MEPNPPEPSLAPPFTIPPPPPPLAAPFTTALPPRSIRAGQLTQSWGRFLLVTWLFVVASFIAIWFSSRNTGLSTWWLGPETEPRFILINLLPFAAPVAMCLMCQLALRWLPWFGIAAALAIAAIAVGDISRVPGYAVAEFTVAAGALLASLASFAGVLRSEPS
ncbi:MAG: hypothetical protein K8R99_14875 [Actinomycetia bacterium]|nr:hypothetical protein [Actinomycetes bacterium]